MKTISISLRELVITDKDSGETVTVRTLRSVEGIAREVCGREAENLREHIDLEYEERAIKRDTP